MSKVNDKLNAATRVFNLHGKIKRLLELTSRREKVKRKTKETRKSLKF